MYLLMPTLPVYVQQIGGGNTAAGLIIGLFSLSAVLARPLFGKLMDSRGRKVVLITGAIIFLIPTVAYRWTDSVWVLLLLRLYRVLAGEPVLLLPGQLQPMLSPPIA